MGKVTTIGIILCFVGLALARRRDVRRHERRKEDDCRSLPEGGVVTWGCRSYTACQAGRPVVVHCTYRGLVYNPLMRTCDNKLATPAPCGLYRDCEGKYDGRYVDLNTNCTAYYTCNNYKFFGHNQCNPGLVFNQGAQVCDWPFNVDAPCGTKGGVTPKPEKKMKKPSRKMTKSKYERRRVKATRSREERVMQLKMRVVKEPKVRRQYSEKKRSKGNMMLRETVHGM